MMTTIKKFQLNIFGVSFLRLTITWPTFETLSRGRYCIDGEATTRNLTGYMFSSIHWLRWQSVFCFILSKSRTMILL